MLSWILQNDWTNMKASFIDKLETNIVIPAKAGIHLK